MVDRRGPAPKGVGPLAYYGRVDRYLDLEPPRASLGQLQLTNKLEMIPVENDVLGVISRLKSIDPGLKMFFDFGQEIFVLYHEGLNEQGHVVDSLVGAYKQLDQRVINLIERIDAQGRGRHDLIAELEKLEAEKDREQRHEQLEKVGELGEELRFALRKDLGLGGSQAYMSGRKGRKR
jgi:hypothetical protein